MRDPYSPARLLVPLITPFDDRNAVDEASLEALANEVLDAGAEGLVALGTTSEASSLSEEERDTVAAVCSRVCAARGAPLIVAAGTNDTATTVRRHEALAGLPGVCASLAVVPYYVRPTEPAIVTHFQFVAERSPVPLILYNIPSRTGRGLGAEAILELAGHPNIVGLKQAVGALDVDTLQILAGAGPDFAVLGGEDAFLFPLMLMGARGAIAASGHLATGTFAQMLDAGAAGDVTAGRALAEALLPLVDTLFSEPNPCVIKAVLHARGRIATPSVRMPLSAASSRATTRALGALAALPAAT